MSIKITYVFKINYYLHTYFDIKIRNVSGKNASLQSYSHQEPESIRPCIMLNISHFRHVSKNSCSASWVLYFKLCTNPVNDEQFLEKLTKMWLIFIWRRVYGFTFDRKGQEYNFRVNFPCRLPSAKFHPNAISSLGDEAYRRKDRHNFIIRFSVTYFGQSMHI